MKKTIGGWQVCLAALALAAGAAFGAESPEATKPATTAATSSTKGDAKSPASPDTRKSAEVPSGYTLVKKDGTDFYCRKEKVTGSRLRTTDVCLTKAQLEAQQRGVQDTLQDMRDTKSQGPAMDSSGGRTIGPVSQ